MWEEVNHREGDGYLSASSKLFTEKLWVKQSVVRCHWTQYHQESAYSCHPRNYGEDNGIIQTQTSNFIWRYMIPIVLYIFLIIIAELPILLIFMVPTVLRGRSRHYSHFLLYSHSDRYSWRLLWKSWSWRGADIITAAHTGTAARVTAQNQVKNTDVFIQAFWCCSGEVKYVTIIVTCGTSSSRQCYCCGSSNPAEHKELSKHLICEGRHPVNDSWLQGHCYQGLIWRDTWH